MAASDQVPTNSGFAPKTDGADVIADIELAGKTAIVTGAGHYHAGTVDGGLVGRWGPSG